MPLSPPFYAMQAHEASQASYKRLVGMAIRKAPCVPHPALRHRASRHSMASTHVRHEWVPCQPVWGRQGGSWLRSSMSGCPANLSSGLVVVGEPKLLGEEAGLSRSEKEARPGGGEMRPGWRGLGLGSGLGAANCSTAHFGIGHLSVGESQS